VTPEKTAKKFVEELRKYDKCPIHTLMDFASWIGKQVNEKHEGAYIKTITLYAADLTSAICAGYTDQYDIVEVTLTELLQDLQDEYGLILASVDEVHNFHEAPETYQ
jgi:hypothetical protein